MRIILVLWFLPIVLFGGWYFLSLNNAHFGYFFLTYDFHQFIFKIYGNMLGLPPEDVPALIAGVFAVDSLIVLGLAALRWHKHWLPQVMAWAKQTFGNEQPPVPMEERPVELAVQSGPVPTGE